ncbi:hypothetical protein IQ241_16615 [Romeria aff. gracilis LEGE 07310]|uniref:Uncharacterized protein n=1 Tax=Vasconcelosia minhoensis LEGE 07310 TaxID=915328 RepID=A0A8J7A9X4_9CYAN|nr:hypothetical protein [Romeria gracilis]MBE9078895.1 hypothetical protein [Romeria aff. gracilis LEGE 07310]
MPYKSQTATTEMQVTSIRFERSLIDKLKAIAGRQGYQALIREVLWDYVERQTESQLLQIRATLPSTAQQQERCALTDRIIQPQEEMLLGLTTDDRLVPLSLSTGEFVAPVG